MTPTPTKAAHEAAKYIATARQTAETTLEAFRAARSELQEAIAAVEHDEADADATLEFLVVLRREAADTILRIPSRPELQRVYDPYRHGSGPERIIERLDRRITELRGQGAYAPSSPSWRIDHYAPAAREAGEVWHLHAHQVAGLSRGNELIEEVRREMGALPVGGAGEYVIAPRPDEADPHQRGPKTWQPMVVLLGDILRLHRSHEAAEQRRREEHEAAEAARREAERRATEARRKELLAALSDPDTAAEARRILAQPQTKKGR